MKEIVVYFMVAMIIIFSLAYYLGLNLWALAILVVLLIGEIGPKRINLWHKRLAA